MEYYISYRVGILVIPPSTVSNETTSGRNRHLRVKPPAPRSETAAKPPAPRCETAAPGTWTNFELCACPWTRGSGYKERRESTDTGRLGEDGRGLSTMYPTV